MKEFVINIYEYVKSILLNTKYQLGIIFRFAKLVFKHRIYFYDYEDIFRVFEFAFDELNDRWWEFHKNTPYSFSILTDDPVYRASSDLSVLARRIAENNYGKYVLDEEKKTLRLQEDSQEERDLDMFCEILKAHVWKMWI